MDLLGLGTDDEDIEVFHLFHCQLISDVIDYFGFGLNLSLFKHALFEVSILLHFSEEFFEKVSLDVCLTNKHHLDSVECLVLSSLFFVINLGSQLEPVLFWSVFDHMGVVGCPMRDTFIRI